MNSGDFSPSVRHAGGAVGHPSLGTASPSGSRRIPWTALSCLLLLLVFGLPAAALTPKTGEYLTRGKNALMKKEFDRAFWYFYVASSIDREQPEPWFYLGIALYRLEDYKNAITALRRSQSLGLTENLRLSCRRTLVECHHRLTRTRIHPVMKKHAAHQSTLWRVFRLMEQGEFDTALTLLTPVWKDLKLDFEIATAMTVCLLRTGREDEVYRPLLVAYRIDPVTLEANLADFRLPAGRIFRLLENYLDREKRLENFFESL